MHVEISTSVAFENKVCIYGIVRYMKATDLKVPTSERLKKIMKIQTMTINIKIIVTTCIKFPDSVKKCLIYGQLNMRTISLAHFCS
jgi:hypothetical protein